jgi:hypothetical protein
MIIPTTRVNFISREKGNGVIATAPIPIGTVTWVFDDLDRTFSPEQFARLSPAAQENVLNYSYTNSKGELVFCWDNERYINHSFHPNCVLTPHGFELAVRDIEIGEEMTNDYGFLNIIAPFSVDNEGTARNTVYPDDLLHFSDQWDALLRDAYARLLFVPQPLQPYFASTTQWQKAEAVAAGRQSMTSIKTLYFHRRHAY